MRALPLPRTRGLASLCCAGLLAAALASPASAAEPSSDGFYAGLSGGVTQYRVKRDDLAASGYTIARKDEKDKGGKLFAGYRLGRHLAVEAQAVQFGKAHVDLSLGAASGRVDYKASAAALSVVAILPLAPELELFGKLGAARTQFEFSPRDAALGRRAKVNASTALLGVGAAWWVTDTLQLRAELETYGKAGERQRGGRSRLQALTVGASYRF